jgi:hypothetical protein
MRNGLLVLLCATIPLLAQAPPPKSEQAEPPRTPSGQKVEQLPIPIVSPTAVMLQDATPLSSGDKARLAFRNTFGWRGAANRLLQAGWDHAFDDPEEWPGDLEGFGMRYGNSYGRLAVRNGLQLAADFAFKTDPRYFRCDCTGFWARTRYAWKRVLVDRRDDGSDFPAVSNFAAAYGTPMVADQWLPDRENTWEHKFWNGTTWLAFRGGSNMIREFWPEIRRTLKIERFTRDTR